MFPPKTSEHKGINFQETIHLTSLSYHTNTNNIILWWTECLTPNANDLKWLMLQYTQHKHCGLQQKLFIKFSIHMNQGPDISCQCSLLVLLSELLWKIVIITRFILYVVSISNLFLIFFQDTGRCSIYRFWVLGASNFKNFSLLMIVFTVEWDVSSFCVITAKSLI